jgi:ribosomal-protein-alanine N-acetyltransferase
MTINPSIFETFPLLETPRLRLRDIRTEDAESIFEMRSNGRVNQFIPREDMNSREAAQELVNRSRHAYQNRQAIGWSGVLRDRPEIIGTCGFNYIDFDNLRAEIGGELDLRYWGKKLAIEAVVASIRFGFEIMTLHTIEAKVAPGNRSAIFLLEQLGFKKEAHFTDRVYFKGLFSDMAVYTLLKKN